MAFLSACRTSLLFLSALCFFVPAGWAQPVGNITDAPPSETSEDNVVDVVREGDVHVDVAPVYGRKEGTSDYLQIPWARTGSGTSYRTWSLFLVCNPEWLQQSTAEKLATLHDAFKNFGRAIGPEHVAVWFWKKPPRSRKSALVENLDTDRSLNFCTKFQLLPSEGPHVLIMTSYPDEKNPPTGKFGVLKLNNLGSEDFIQLLAKLADQLVVEGLNQKELDSATWWLIWERSIKEAIKAIGDKVKNVNFTLIGVSVEGEKH